MKDVMKEVEREVQSLMRLMEAAKVECDSDDVECMLRRAVVYVNLKRRLDKLIYQLAFVYVATDDVVEKEAVEKMVEAVAKTGFITEQRWVKAVSDAFRYRNKIDGVEPRRRVRKMSEEGLI